MLLDSLVEPAAPIASVESQGLLHQTRNPLEGLEELRVPLHRGREEGDSEQLGGVGLGSRDGPFRARASSANQLGLGPQRRGRVVRDRQRPGPPGGGPRPTRRRCRAIGPTGNADHQAIFETGASFVDVNRDGAARATGRLIGQPHRYFASRAALSEVPRRQENRCDAPVANRPAISPAAAPSAAGTGDREPRAVRRSLISSSLRPASSNLRPRVWTPEKDSLSARSARK